MKKAPTLLAILLLFLMGCSGNQQQNKDFIAVDVTKSYPEKELTLQDFMDVEYVLLETTDLVYDTEEQGIYQYTVYNQDFSERTVDMASRCMDDKVAFYVRQEAQELVAAYEKGLLKGKLKEIASKINEESNPVIMLVKHKTIIE